MNKNLKNRPMAIDSSTGYLEPNPHDPDSMSDWIQNVEEWFRDFEKELRERKAELERYNKEHAGDCFNNMRLTLIAQINEVLGLSEEGLK